MSIQETKKWFEAAVPAPTEENFNVQLGCHLEEVVEMLGNICGKCPDSEYAIASAEEALSRLAEGLKCGEFSAYIDSRTDHLDALTDQIVTAVGCAHMACMDIVGALDEVNRSNFSKFEDGKPVFNEHGKIAKGRDYKAPELEKFVGVGGMSNQNNGGPAFPESGPREMAVGGEGMTLRDYYAAHAPITLQDAIWAMQQVGETVKTGEELITFFAQLRLAYADAMLKEREK